jgi:hypothetical protein
VVSPGDWPVSNIWFLLSTELVALSFSCNSVWSAPLPTRWGNSVLNMPSVLLDQLQDPPHPPLAPLWEVGLLPTPTRSLCCFTCITSLRVGDGAIGPTLVLWARFSIPPLPLLSELDYSLLFMVFSFLGSVQSSQGLHWIIFPGGE